MKITYTYKTFEANHRARYYNEEFNSFIDAKDALDATGKVGVVIDAMDHSTRKLMKTNGIEQL